MTTLDNGKKYIIKENYPNVQHKMIQHPVFHEFLAKATDEQLDMLNSILDNKVQIVFTNANSGTGKTQMAVLAAYALYLESDCNQELLYIMSPVEEGSLGFTKGSIHEKEAKYMTPLHDALEAMNMNPIQAIRNPELEGDQNVDDVWCNTKTHVYVRGSNIKNRTLIIEEAQNFTTNDLQKVLSRVHDNTKVICIGHDKQIDLQKPNKSGFTRYIEHFEGLDYARVHNLSRNYRGRLSQHSDSIKFEKK